MTGLSAVVRLGLGELRLEVELETDGVLAIAGPNGAGKTTLLRAIAGAQPVGAGRISVSDRTLFDADGGIDLPPEERRVGYVPQGFGLFPHMSALDNVAFGLLARGRRAVSGAHDVARAALERLDASRLAARYPAELSGGEKQRVALARALVTEPDVLLLDEPLAAMDVTARRSLRGHLARHLELLGCPTLVVTHDVRDVRALGARLMVMESGRAVRSGSLDEVASEPGTDFVSEFLGAE